MSRPAGPSWPLRRSLGRRANSAHVRQSRPDYGLDWPDIGLECQGKVLESLYVVPTLPESGGCDASPSNHALVYWKLLSFPINTLRPTRLDEADLQGLLGR